MNHAPAADYVNAGYRYERAQSPDAARALIEQGRKEARGR